MVVLDRRLYAERKRTASAGGRKRPLTPAPVRPLPVRQRRPLTQHERHLDVELAIAQLEAAKAALRDELEAEKLRYIQALAAGVPTRMRRTEAMDAILQTLHRQGMAHALEEMRSMGVPAHPATPGLDLLPPLGLRSSAAGARATSHGTTRAYAVDYGRLQALYDDALSAHFPRRPEGPLPYRLAPVSARMDQLIWGIQQRVDETFPQAEQDITEALGFSGASQAMAPHLIERLRDIPGALDVASRVVSSAQFAGVADVFGANTDAFGGWQYSAVMDSGTCEVCAALDGTVYESLDEALSDLPNWGPNPQCLGDGRCRCRLIGVPPGSAIPGLGGYDPGSPPAAPPPQPEPGGEPGPVEGPPIPEPEPEPPPEQLEAPMVRARLLWDEIMADPFLAKISDRAEGDLVATQSIQRLQGFSGPGLVVDRAALDDAASQGEVRISWHPMLEDTRERQLEQTRSFRDGDLLPAATNTLADKWAATGHLFRQVPEFGEGSALDVNATLRPQARVVELRDLEAERDRVRSADVSRTLAARGMAEASEDYELAKLIAREHRARETVYNDLGKFAAARGYDAVHVSIGDMPRQRDYGWLILNRTMLRIEAPPSAIPASIKAMAADQAFIARALENGRGASRANAGDGFLATIYERLGFNALPEVLSPSAFQARLREPGVKELWRGVGDTHDGRDAAAHFREDATHYPGYGVYGNGTYTAVADESQNEFGSARKVAENYGTNLIHMALKPGARIVDEDVLYRAQMAASDEYNAETGRLLQGLTGTARADLEAARIDARRVLIDDQGRFAAASGYDGMRVPKRHNGSWADYLVLYNRGAVAVEEAVTAELPWVAAGDQRFARLAQNSNLMAKVAAKHTNAQVRTQVGSEATTEFANLASVVEPSADFAAPPTVVTKARMDELASMQGSYDVMYRGISMGVSADGRIYSGAQFAQQLREGDYYAGQGTSGSGIFTADTEEVARRYSTPNGVVVRMAMASDANWVSANALSREMREWRDADNAATQLAVRAAATDTEKFALRKAFIQREAVLYTDPGRFAIARGYDGIIDTVSSDSIVLNRSKLIVEEAPPPPPKPAAPPPGEALPTFEAQASVPDLNAYMEARHEGVRFDLDERGVSVQAANETAAELDRLFQMFPGVVRRIGYIGSGDTALGRSMGIVQDDMANTYAFAQGPRHGGTVRAGPGFTIDNNRHSAIVFGRALYGLPYDQLVSHIKSDVLSGFHPRGIVGHEVASIATHEFGHLVDYWARELEGAWVPQTGPYGEGSIRIIMREWQAAALKNQTSTYKTKRNKGAWYAGSNYDQVQVSYYALKNSRETWAEAFTAAVWRDPYTDKSKWVKGMRELMRLMTEGEVHTAPTSYDPWGASAAEERAYKLTINKLYNSIGLRRPYPKVK